MHVCVVTCAHRGDDARIVHRQARTLLEAGHRVTLISPPPDDCSTDPPGLERRAIPRAVGRRRLRAWRATRRAVRSVLPGTDLLLVHDPELISVLGWPRPPVPAVWDVHEDFSASIRDRRYIPRPFRPAAVAGVAAVQHIARRRWHVILAEDSYARQFPGAPVVPNSSWVPEDVASAITSLADGALPVAMYVGRLSNARGATELVQLGRQLRDEIDVVLIGAADAGVAPVLREAHEAGDVRWLGPLPNPVALDHVRRAGCGLSLLHDEPNYRQSRPTKVIEYLANGIPVVATPLPLAAELIERSGAGEVIGFGDVASAAAAVRRLVEPEVRADLGRAGHDYVARHHNWAHDGVRFVELLAGWAAR